VHASSHAEMWTCTAEAPAAARTTNRIAIASTSTKTTRLSTRVYANCSTAKVTAYSSAS